MTELLSAGMPTACHRQMGHSNQWPGQAIHCLGFRHARGNRDTALPAATGMAACLCTCITHTCPGANQTAITRSKRERLSSQSEAAVETAGKSTAHSLC